MLMEALIDRGFELAAPAGLPLAEQIALFRDAEVIVSPHGAGLTNMLFARPGCRVVDLVGRKLYSTCYLMMASALGHAYGYVACTDVGRDLRVRPQHVVTVLDQLEAGAQAGEA
jgi:capsular polysaccharide biosynthesis protein